jgi:hypothetical protein
MYTRIISLGETSGEKWSFFYFKNEVNDAAKHIRQIHK